MIENILANLKIERLNPMQEASINAWKEGKDLILLSPTGSGKTLAYLLPLVQSLPKLAGWSGSPSTPTMRSPAEWMMTPQPVPQ